MNYLYLDIETLPAASVDLDLIKSELTPPANYKNPAAIEAWLSEKAQEVALKGGLDRWQGQIACICADYVSGENEIFNDTFQAYITSGDIGLIKDFFGFVRSLPDQSRFTVVGHNLAGFDLPFINARATIDGVAMPDFWPKHVKAWDIHLVHDTMTLAGFGTRDMVSLAKLARAFGIDAKGDMDGSQVKAVWDAGEYQRVLDYCCQDVQITKEVHQRFLSVGAV